MRYTSKPAYQLLKQYLPLPSETTLLELRSHTIQSSRALCGLRDNQQIGNDVVLLIDEMHLQQQVQYDGRTIVGCDGDLQMYRSVLSFMVVSITKSIPYVLKAIPIVRLSYEVIYNTILNCLSVLNQGNFYIRAIITDNHRTNISAFKHLYVWLILFLESRIVSLNPNNPSQHIFLMFDTVHLIKNVRNNLLAKRSFEVPCCKLTLFDKSFDIQSGNVYWACLHRIHEHDLKECTMLRKAPKINYYVLHPGNNKQSVPLALAIFHPTTTTAISSYHPE